MFARRRSAISDYFRRLKSQVDHKMATSMLGYRREGATGGRRGAHGGTPQPRIRLQPISASELYQRRTRSANDTVRNRRQDARTMSLGNAICARCSEGFGAHEQMVNSGGEVWHTKCFVCAQCFQPFPDGVFYEFEGRKYCEHDFHVLFAPCCGLCRQWGGKAVGTDKYMCHKCHTVCEEGHIKYKSEVYHPYHFNCKTCGVELNLNAREKDGELYCLRCHDKMGIPICGACRRPIEDARIVNAMGKQWHVEHFVCAKCEKPFLGSRHFEKKGQAYCELHYHKLFGNVCFVCNQVVTGDVFQALNKSWCVPHFSCSLCDQKMGPRTKFYEFDLKPVCKKCYERFPGELKRRLMRSLKQSPYK
ncbi:PREDICTED: LIM and senescent cell antigen-like-containing domain protein 1 [Priapulus caudatus]|uniref:LIM and senescent cell antigen-like-containing domain protein 1 n=1 Tax=Priapulus caudatus TaxID=37621 RepID=A0ABM1DPI5_PRICU|nr:PREDICTED: LIM and senescent cell antigen-like-containing domain protein 1 [Priapulus caudatus]